MIGQVLWLHSANKAHPRLLLPGVGEKETAPAKTHHALWFPSQTKEVVAELFLIEVETEILRSNSSVLVDGRCQEKMIEPAVCGRLSVYPVVLFSRSDFRRRPGQE